MAGPRGGGSRAADHRTDRSGDERDAQDRGDAFGFALRSVRRHSDLPGRRRQRGRPSGSVQPAFGAQPAGRSFAVGVAAVGTLGPDLPLRAAELRPLADGAENARSLDGRAPVQVGRRGGGRFGFRRRHDAVPGAARPGQDRRGRQSGRRPPWSRRRSGPTTPTPAAGSTPRAASSSTSAAKAGWRPPRISATSS